MSVDVFLEMGSIFVKKMLFFYYLIFAKMVKNLLDYCYF